MGKSILVTLVSAALGCGAGTIFGGFPKGTAIGGVIGGIVGLVALRDRARREKQLREMAGGLGFQYLGDDAWRELPRFAIFGHLPGNPGLFHAIRGERDGATVLYCDSRMGIGATTMRYRPAAILYAPELDLPHFVTHPSQGPAGIYNVKLGVRLELPANPKSHASGEGPAAASVFTPEVLDVLAHDPLWLVEGWGSWLIALRWETARVFYFPYHARVLPPSSVPAFLEEALALLRRFRTRRAA